MNTQFPDRMNVKSGSSPGAESDDSNVFRGRAFLTLHNIKFHFFTFIQGFETFALNGAVVAEDIFFTVVTRDESEALFCVKPLNCSCRCHCSYS
jgi:hypothetical protein